MYAITTAQYWHHNVFLNKKGDIHFSFIRKVLFSNIRKILVNIIKKINENNCRGSALLECNKLAAVSTTRLAHT